MTAKSINKVWEFECTLQNGKELKSWFYSDSKEDATKRITDYLKGNLKSLIEINDPLEIDKKQKEKEEIRKILDEKKQKEHDLYLKKNDFS